MAIRKKIILALSIIAGGFLLALPSYRYRPPRVESETAFSAHDFLNLAEQKPPVVPDVRSGSLMRPVADAHALQVPIRTVSTSRTLSNPFAPPEQREVPVPTLAADYHTGARSMTVYKPLTQGTLKPVFRIHRIVDGDTLGDLAERYLGDARRAEEIFELNRDILGSPTLLPIGAPLQIPPA